MKYDDKLLEKTEEYLNAVKILISPNSDMEDIIYQRDRFYGEDNDVQRCIDAIRNIRGK